MRRYQSLLACPRVLRLLASSLLARLPLGMSNLALILVVRGLGESFALAGLASGMLTLASAAASPIQGRLIRRFGPSQTVGVTAAGQSLMLALLGLAAQERAMPAVLVGLASVAGALLPPVSACSRSLWPQLVTDPGLLEAAYALDAISQELLWTCGPLLVALATTLYSAVLGLWVSAIFTLTGGVVFAAAPAVRGARRVVRRRTREDSPLANPALIVALASITGLGLADGSLTLGLTALASHLGAPAAAGAFLGMLSLGSVVGGTLHGSRTWRWPTWWRFRLLLACSAVLVLPLCLASSIPGGLFLAAVAGLSFSAMMSCQFALIHEATTPDNTAEAFTWNTAALVVGTAVGTSLAGLAVRPFGSPGPFLLSAISCLVACAITLVALRYRGSTGRTAADGAISDIMTASTASGISGEGPG